MRDLVDPSPIEATFEKTRKKVFNIRFVYKKLHDHIKYFKIDEKYHVLGMGHLKGHRHLT